jgi:ABC-2 type transport system ATP-binding protein
MAEFVIETHALTKRYDELTAVDSLDLQVEEGEVYGLLGPNGSGKTTTILMLLGLTEPTEGEARILGFDPMREPLKVKARVGYMPDQVGFYNNLTAGENLIYMAKLIGLSRVEYAQRIPNALARIGLSQVADKQVSTFSHGMRQRLAVAELLLKNPRIIIMDEPTIGLDPDAARRFLEIVEELSQEGITILLSSHLLHQVQQVCDRVGLFHQGRIVLEGPVSELARQTLGVGFRINLLAEGDSPGLLEALRGIPGVSEVEFDGAGGYVVHCERDLRAEAARAIVRAAGDLQALTIREPDLDEVYGSYFERHGEVQDVGGD